MRLLFILLALGSAVPATAQQQPIERRVNRLEQEMRAVQRRVFPNGVANTLEPELQPADPVATRPDAPGTNAISVLTARIEALEAQLARVTGQVEENGYRITQLDEQVRQLRSDLETRIGRLETAAARPQPAAEPPATTTEPATEPATPATGSATTPQGQPIDRIQEAYNAGYRLWAAGRHAEAAEALNTVADRNPRSRWASWARNLAGRAYLDDNQPARAAQTFLRNYQDNPRGERAADSLFFLGEALVKLDRRAEACPVYAELEANYPNMRSVLREGLPAARRAARCN